MANTTIKITQLPNIGGNLSANTLLPVVDTTGTAVTEKVTVGNVANFILTQAGNLLPEAFVSQIAYSVANAAQPNITSVGNLSSLTITNLDNFSLPGGTNGYVLQTDGAGHLNWTAMSGSGNGNPGGANGQLQFNDNGLFAGSTALSWDASTDTLNTVNIAASDATIYGNVNVVNVNATENINANNLAVNNFTVTDFTASGNVTASYFIGNVEYANVANYAGNVYSISGANVVGEVANANYSARVDITPTTNNFSYHVVLVENPGGSQLQVDDDDHLQYNPATGLLTAIRVDAQNFVGNLQYAYGLPASNVSGLGNISTLNLNGNSNNVLYGNGQWGASTNTTWANISNINNNYGPDKIAIGINAGANTQGNETIALGYYAGNDSQGQGAVAIGMSAGQMSQGANTVALGSFAGQVNQDNNSTVINATGTNLGSAGANTFVVKPVRQVSGSVPSGFYPTYYNPTTGEFIVVTP